MDKEFKFRDMSAENLGKALEMYNKGLELQKANYQTTGSAAYTGQVGVVVEPQLIDINPAKDFLMRRWRGKSKTNMQLAAVYSVLNSVSFVSATNPFFQEGKCPPSVQYSTVQTSKVKKHYGVEGGMTNAALAALNNPAGVKGINGQILDAYDRHLRILDTRFRNSEEWAIINGNTGTDPNAFNGLDAEITSANGSLVINLGNTSLQKSDINEIISVQSLRGVAPSVLVSNPLMIDNIHKLYYNSANTSVEQLDEWKFPTIPTPVGPVALVGTPAVGVTFTSGDGYSTSVYILAEQYEGEDLLYMDYLIPETILPNELFSNGTNCTSTTFGIYAVGTLVNRAPVAQAKITNAKFSVNTQLNSVVTALSGIVI